MKATTNSNAGQSTAAVPWDWREQANACSARGLTRRRAVIQALCMMALGGLLHGVFGHRTAAYFIWGISFFLLLGACCMPPILKGFERLGAGLALAIGAGMTYLLLTPMFFMVFTPGRFFMALAGRDPLQCKFDQQSGTYWHDRPPSTSPDHYSRQY